MGDRRTKCGDDATLYGREERGLAAEMEREGTIVKYQLRGIKTKEEE